MPPRRIRWTGPWLAAVTLGLVIICSLLAAQLFWTSPGPSLAQTSREEQRVRELVMSWIESGVLERDDGHIYAIDVTQILNYAALARDRKLFDRMWEAVGRHLIIEDSDGKDEWSWVGWRHPSDASGTTEALRMAEALWNAAEAFERPGLRETALSVLRGYARHAGHDQGYWLIRNYYHLASGRFATNSYLVDYDPDFLRRVARHQEESGSGPWHDLARRSTRMVVRAQSPTGLLHQVIQPELVTLMPKAIPIFSPNGVERVANSAAIAERSLKSAPHIAHALLDFLSPRLPDVRRDYDTLLGNPVGRTKAGISLAAPLIRLALEAGRPALAREAWPLFAHDLKHLEGKSPQHRLFVAGEALLTLQRMNRSPPES